MARFRGVIAKGAGILIHFQVNGRRHWKVINKAPTERNLQDAARLRASLIESARLGTGTTTSRTFEACAAAFLAEKRKTLKPSTLDGYTSKLEHYWSDLAHLEVRAIKPAELKRIDALANWTSQKTRRDAHAVLRGVLAWAVEHEYADSNPATRLKAGAWQRPEIDAFADAERLAILNELAGHARVFYGLMFETGARTGELMALRWSDVQGDTLRIERSVYRGQDGTTKTHQGRSVLLTAEAQRLLTGHTETRFKGGHVFLTQYGTPYSNDRGLTYAFRAACGRAGVRYRRPYYARHTYASRALSAGCEPSWVAEQMGDRLETVLRHYGRWIAQDRGRSELAKLEKCYQNVGGKVEKRGKQQE
jgi:integrase